MSIQVFKVVDIADQIHRELGSPTDLGISVIAFWVRTNIGGLNNMINQNFKITPTQLDQSITNATKLVFLNSPSNPPLFGLNLPKYCFVLFCGERRE